MALTNAYVQGIKKMPELFEKIRDGQAPGQFTNQLLKDWGLSSTNDRLFIPLLKALGFLSQDGKPTSRYQAYRDHSRCRSVMGEALKEAYQDLFLIKSKPTKDDRPAIQGKFKSYHNATDRMADLMTGTFVALLDLADLDATAQKPAPAGKDEKRVEAPVDASTPATGGTHTATHRVPGLHYNIQIHLPATKDVEVYNAIFQALKDHLYEA